MFGELGEGGGCASRKLLVVLGTLACVDGALAFVAFSQVVRIHLWDQTTGWTRQKVLHLMIGSSNLGYLIFFVLTVVASCEMWFCWSHMCGFFLTAYPNILFLAAFLLLLSFWVDFCHQANDEDEGDENEEQSSIQQHLLGNSNTTEDSTLVASGCKCCSFNTTDVGGRQKFVLTVVALVFVLMISFAVVIGIGKGNNPIDSLLVAKVYTHLFAVVSLLIGGAIVCYGVALLLKLRKVRSESVSSDMWKVAGLTAVCAICFTSSASVALSTDTPLFYSWHLWEINGIRLPLLLVLYYLIGSSVPSAFLLWVTRELPRPIASNTRREHTVLTFVSYDATTTYYCKLSTAASTSRN